MFIMKYFIGSILFSLTIFLLVKVNIAAQIEVSEFINLHKDIEKEVPEDLGKFLEVLIQHSANPSKELKCQRGCLMKALQLLTSDNKLSKQSVVAFVGHVTNQDPQMMEAAAIATDICNEKVQVVEECEAADQYRECFMEAMFKISQTT